MATRVRTHSSWATQSTIFPQGHTIEQRRSGWCLKVATRCARTTPTNVTGMHQPSTRHHWTRYTCLASANTNYSPLQAQVNEAETTEGISGRLKSSIFKRLILLVQISVFVQVLVMMGRHGQKRFFRLSVTPNVLLICSPRIEASCARPRYSVARFVTRLHPEDDAPCISIGVWWRISRTTLALSIMIFLRVANTVPRWWACSVVLDGLSTSSDVFVVVVAAAPCVYMCVVAHSDVKKSSLGPPAEWIPFRLWPFPFLDSL